MTEKAGLESGRMSKTLKLSVKMWQGLQHKQWIFRRILKGNYFGDTRVRAVTGVATYTLFDHDPCQLLYREEGVVRFEGQTNRLTAYQEYLYCFENSDDIGVFFLHSRNGQKEAGNLFHRIVLAEKDTHHVCGKGFHLCGKDEYESDYLFEMHENEIEKFYLNHQVKGPQKNYVAHTIFLKEVL